LAEPLRIAISVCATGKILLLPQGLRGCKDNSRRGYDEQMSDVVEPMTDEEFADLAHVLARLK